jgi:hypothetical protein
MDTIIQQDSLDDPRVEAERNIIRPILDDIAQEVGNRLRDEGLNFPIFLTVPRSRIAIATMATPLDPQDDLWLRAVAIVSQIVSERLSGIKLRSREVVCAMANTTMSAADLTAD